MLLEPRPRPPRPRVAHPSRVIAGVDPVLADLLVPRPERVTRMQSSHDPSGRNGDNTDKGMPWEGDYRVMFHGRGEGRIVRLWMTQREADIPQDWIELWIEIDGKTLYRGPPLGFFQGRGPFKAPLVLDSGGASGGYLSWAPMPYQREARILFKGHPRYYQVSYQQGPGSSAGPDAEAIGRFLSDPWWSRAPAPDQAARASRGSPVTIARGPALVTALAIATRHEDLPRLRLRVGMQPSFPATYLFGYGTARTDPGGLPDLRPIPWQRLRSALWFSDPDEGVLKTRLPIPLRAGEELRVEADGADLRYAVETATEPWSGGVSLVTQYREQYAPGAPTTFPVFEAAGSLTLLSTVVETSEGIPGDRTFLEGDDIVYTDGMRYPLLLGTGTEDYFNGGWYFLGVHTNPTSGLTRFDVLHGDAGWDEALFEHSMYRLHVLDPIIGRSGIRFGLEAGEEGAYAPLFYRTFALAYTFDGLGEIARARFVLDKAKQWRGTRMGVPDTWVRSALDAERDQPVMEFPVRSHRAVTRLRVPCPRGATPTGMLLVRTFDQGTSGQAAAVRVNGGDVGTFFERYANSARRLAEDVMWIDLVEGDCDGEGIQVDIDARESPHWWTESAYEAVLYAHAPAAR